VSPQRALLSASCKLDPDFTTVFAPGAGVLAIDELTETRGNSAGPSVNADAVVPKMNIKAAVNIAERRTNPLLENTETRMLTSYSLVRTHFPGKEAVNENCAVVFSNSH
jgi:hypothetical protein